ncbi:hypothetical protein [Pseudomonas sichuanensis]|uniref:hypothetical protein n=1 Tax=Pseudomonas sichuanensis TaxID=2213015 RepID=UPI000DA663F9|nr:hypothetical protein [Pseudomonas sichuanensis]
MSVIEKIQTVCIFALLVVVVFLSQGATNAKKDAKDQERLAALYKGERDGWINTAEQRALDLQLATIRRAQAEQSVTDLQARLGDLGQQHEPARQAVRASTLADDGPVAPVLRNALELLP